LENISLKLPFQSSLDSTLVEKNMSHLAIPTIVFREKTGYHQLTPPAPVWLPLRPWRLFGSLATVPHPARHCFDHHFHPLRWSLRIFSDRNMGMDQNPGTS
jgi:hypothetical protein